MLGHPHGADAFRARLLDPDLFVRLYGTTPPRLGSSDDAVMEAATKLSERVKALGVDALVVYDIQDESGRTSVPRPFPFTGTIDPRDYAALLTRLSGLPTINYKSLGSLDGEAWKGWLDDTASRCEARFLSVVGRPTAGVKYSLSLPEAVSMAAGHRAAFTVGGVVIAERDDEHNGETERLLTKVEQGCRYFISQTVYESKPMIRLLKNYLSACDARGIAPSRIVLTFAPCGRAKTMAFIKWLGVRITPECERSILDADSPLSKSIEICRENLREILDQDYAVRIPLGINVESVSINRDEIDATVDLYHALSEELSVRGG